MLDDLIEYLTLVLVPISITHAIFHMVFGIEGFWYYIIQGFVLFVMFRVFWE